MNDPPTNNRAMQDYLIEMRKYMRLNRKILLLLLEWADGQQKGFLRVKEFKMDKNIDLSDVDLDGDPNKLI